jgi:hypothetical protein
MTFGPIMPAPHTTREQTPSSPLMKDIIATEFGGINDKNASAYGGMVDGNKLGVALPFHFVGTRPLVRLIRGDKQVDAPIVDVGPWNTHDPYWDTGTRPQAESGRDMHGRKTNLAGIDMTPATWEALGVPGLGKGEVDWQFAPVVTPIPPVEPPVVPPVVPPVPAPTKWPLQSQCLSFYGDPRKSGWLQANTTHVACPWPLYMDGGIVLHDILIHKKCAASLGRVLQAVWAAVGHDAAKIHAFRYDIYDGSYNLRVMRGGASLSMHSYACAIDWDAKDNQQHSQHHLFTDQSLLIVKFKEEGWIWGGDWSPGSIDAMHVQAARVHP